MTTEELQSILHAEGYLSTTDNDGDLVFKAQGRYLYASADENDSDFVRIFLDIQMTCSATKLDGLEAANSAARRFKCVKCMLLHHDDESFQFRIAVECFTDVELLMRDISRYIDIVCSATHHIARALRIDD